MEPVSGVLRVDRPRSSALLSSQTGHHAHHLVKHTGIDPRRVSLIALDRLSPSMLMFRAISVAAIRHSRRHRAVSCRLLRWIFSKARVRFESLKVVLRHFIKAKSPCNGNIWIFLYINMRLVRINSILMSL